ncbi:unnamed protein product [Staurois parvus]|uniref:Uncharacterized protein n=1 Tax=Staurois parvus TaxID=386267 RepID=A0ABN9F7B7_9NEOB|nr:unnamed protein product [Staurois parvus]
MTAGTGHLARQRAPRHLARQWAPSQQARQWAPAPGHQVPIVWLDSGHRVTRYDSGHWVTRHQVIWLAHGHRVIWQGSGHRVTRYDSGSESIGTTAAPDQVPDHSGFRPSRGFRRVEASGRVEAIRPSRGFRPSKHQAE